MSTDTTTDNWAGVEAAARALLPTPVLRHIEETRRQANPASHLIAVLHTLQDTLGYLGDAQLDAVAQLMRIPAAKVSGVATFYHYFRLRPAGRFVISLCMGTACYVKGAMPLLEKLQQELGIDPGQTTEDGLFSLEEARCVGTCGLAPVLTINGRVHARCRPEQIPGILADCRRRRFPSDNA